jgi:uncharacterized protein YjbI with pentapeptide repeats
MKEVNFSMCDKLIFDIAFTHCVLDFAKFYTLKLKGTSFVHCSLIAVDNKANFKTSYNYSIDPTKTKIKKAVFALAGLKGLLTKYVVVVE